MNREQLVKIILEEMGDIEALDENFLKKMMAKLRGAKDGGWEAVAAAGEDEEPSSQLAGGPGSSAKIDVRSKIAGLLRAGLPADIAQKLFDEIVKQLKNIHGYTDAMIKEVVTSGVQSPRRTSNMPSRKKILDLTAVPIPKNMIKDVEKALNALFRGQGFEPVRLNQGPAMEVEPARDQKPAADAAVEPEQKETKYSNNEVSISRKDTIEGLAMKIMGVKEKPKQSNDKEKFRELSFVRGKIMDIFKKAASELHSDIKIRTIAEEKRMATLKAKGFKDSPSTSISGLAAQILGLQKIPVANKGDKEQYRAFSTVANKLKRKIHQLIKIEFGLNKSYSMEEGTEPEDIITERWQKIAGIIKG